MSGKLTLCLRLTHSKILHLPLAEITLVHTAHKEQEWERKHAILTDCWIHIAYEMYEYLLCYDKYECIQHDYIPIQLIF